MGRTQTGLYPASTAARERFTPAAQWIWDAKGEREGWWMFRRAFQLPAASVASARLLVTSCQYHIVYLNGRPVTRGPSRSYDFAKTYHVIDVSCRVEPAQENVLAILSPELKQKDAPAARAPNRGLIAELVVETADGRTLTISTDRSWKAMRHPAFRLGTPWYAIPLGPEEWFDGRLEPEGWTARGFDGSTWQAAAEIGPVGTPPWYGMQKAITGELSSDEVWPKRFTAIELATPRLGRRFRIGSADDGVKVFATEIRCPEPTTVRLWFKDGAPRVAVNGIALPAGGDLALPAGTSFVCMCRLAYGGGDLELLLESERTLEVSARRILGGADTSWATLTLSAKTVKYPWHETAEDVLATIPEIPALLGVLQAADLPAELRRRFHPADEHEPSVMHGVVTQRFHHVSGGYTDPAIERGQPRLEAPAGSAAPVLRAQNMLHGHDECSEVVPQPGMDVHFVVDFDTEVIGHVRLALDAPAGTVVDVQCFELIDGSGIAWMHVHNGFRYVCREGMQEFTSHYRRGFRYVSVTLRSFARPVRIRGVSCLHTAYPVQEIGRFESSDALLNQVYRMSVDTARLCMLDTYVDCPGHEQNFWVGDARITALINLLTFGGYDLNQYFICIVGQSLRPEWVREYWPDDPRYLEGRYLPIAAFPNYPEGCLPMWTFLWIMQCWEHYLHGGDRAELRENYGYVTATLGNCRGLTNERGLFDMPGAWNLIEWGNNDLSPYGEVTANNVLLVKCVHLAAAMARELGEPDAARLLDEEASARAAAVNRLCWDPARGAYVDTVRDEWAYGRYESWSRSQGIEPVPWRSYLGYTRVSEQTNTLALICDCVPQEREAQVAAIARRVEEGRYVSGAPFRRTSGTPSEQEAPGGIVAVGSPFFLFFSLEGLFRMGLAQTALEVMRRDWGSMAEHGTRTCWETFKGDEKHWTRSVAHAWAAAPAVYLPTRVLGVRPVEPGYRTFVIEPCPGDLRWARGTVATPHGPIHVSWKRTPGGPLDVSFTAPPECRRVEAAQDKARG